MEKRLTMILACMFLSIGIALAQTKVTGTVISQDDGQPIIGASVIPVGSKTGTVTNFDGKFTLTVPAGKKIQVSYIGMVSQTLTPKANMKIVLRSDAHTLGDVVVTGMQKMDRRTFTGAADRVKAEDALIGGMPDISRSLEGRAAGVSVQNVSGTFGTAPKIRVRGATSIYGSSKPLWVVDGVIMEDITDVSADDLSSGDPETLISSAIAGLNSDDIETFDILKDGAATSIYGARAMSGVIVVTTKKGKMGAAHINYTGEFTTRLKPSYRNFNILNSQDQMGIYREIRDKGWLSFSDVLNGSNYGVYGKMYELINTYNTANGQFGLPNTIEAQNQYLYNAEMRNTNWFDELFSNSVMQNHALSISGGTEKSNYYVSMSAMVDPGWYKKSDVKRYTANMNVTHRILENLSLNLISSGSYRKQTAPGTLGQDIDPVSGEVKRDFDINPYSYSLNSSRALDPDTYYQSNYAPFNIFNELENNYMDLNVFDLKFQAELKYKPIKDLELAALGAVKYAGSSQEHNITENSNMAQSYRAAGNSQIRDNNPYLYTDPEDPYALAYSVLPNGGFYKRKDNRMTSYDFRATFNYNHTFAKVHNVNLFGGTEITSIERSTSRFDGVGMQYDMGSVPFYTYQYFKKITEENADYYALDNSTDRSAAFYGVLTYSYRQKYNLNGTLRYEGSNRMGKSTSARWLPTWNVSGSWNVHDEPFFDKVSKVMSHLTLKASYSLTADHGPWQYASNTTPIFYSYTPWRPFSSDKEPGITESYPQNSNLTYEKKHEFSTTLETGFLNNRISVEFGLFFRNNYDLIGQIITMQSPSQQYANVASMKSHGEELSITSTNIKTKDFNWTTNFIYSHAVTKVTDLNTLCTTMDLVSGSGFALEGYPARGIFSIPFKGLDENGYPTFLNEKGEITSTDINFQERENNSYLIYEGPSDPTVTGSLGNVFTYKGFRLNVFITYAFGNVVRLDPVFSARYSDMSSMTKEFNNRWMVPGDEATTNVPVILSRRQYNDNFDLRIGYNAYNFSSERIAKGDFIRMKEISFGYDFPKAWFKSTPFNSLSLKLQATNLFLIYSDSKLNGQDPEFFNTGGVAAPVPKQFTLTVKVGL